MAGNMVVLKGIVRGRMIELEHESGLRDGQAVNVVLRRALPAGEGLRKSFGSWGEGGEQLHRFVDGIYADRADERTGPAT